MSDTPELVYLASPYSHPDPDVKQKRYEEVCIKAAKLMAEGYLVFCPIAHSHPIETIGMPDVKSGDWWLLQDFALLKHCDKMIVYMMPGWGESYGVKKEIEFASRNGIPIEFSEV